MKLLSLGLLNWANLENDNYHFGEVNMITGDSGAGKTTLLDALQTVMTGATSGLYQYNPGQEESTQKSRTKETRTLASYILGCDDGFYSRFDGSHGYIIASWVPEPGERTEPFAAVIGVSAYLDMAGSKRTAKEEDLFMAVIRSSELGVEDFQREKENGEKHIVPLNDIIQHFKLTHPEMKLEVARGKEDYLCMLYGAFRGRNSVNKIEARNAAKAISKFMVYKPIKSLDNFVRQEILEPNDLSDAIRQVSNMMKNISSMENEAKNIGNGISLLKRADEGIRDFINTALEEQLALYESLEREISRIHGEFLKARENEQRCLREKAQLEKEESECDNRLRVLRDQLRTLDIKSQGIDVFQRKKQLEEEIGRLEEEKRQNAVLLLDMNGERSENRRFAVKLQQALNREHGWLRENEGATWETLLTGVIHMDTWDDLCFEKIFSSSDFERLNEIAGKADGIDRAHNDLADQLSQEADSLGDRYFQIRKSAENLIDKIKRLRREIVQLENANEVTYPAHIRRALKMIQETYPEADARVLCDHIEIIDESWQMAIEGLLGGNRFLILVNPEFEGRTLALIERNGLNKSAVVQGKKASMDARRLTLPEKSIVNLVRFDHHLAENYFRAGYGNVQQVVDVEALRMMPRGLMKNGMASAGYKMFVERIAEADLVFGAEARKRALKAKKEQMEELEKQYDSTQSQVQFFRIWHDAVKGVKRIDLGGPLSGILRGQGALTDSRRQMGDLDLSEYKEIEEKIQHAKEEIDKLSKRNRQINEEKGSLKTDIKTQKERIETLSDKKEKKSEEAEKIEAVIDGFAGYWSALDVDSEMAKIRENRQSIEPLHPFEGQNFGGLLNKGVKAVEMALDEFNRIRIRGRSLDYKHFSESNLTREQSRDNRKSCFAFACDLYREIDRALNFLSNDILANHREKLEEMTKRFNTAFVLHICHTMHNAIRDGKSRLEALNRKLRNHVFGEEYYRFEYEWIPEYKEYVRFFKASMQINTDSDYSLFGGDFSEENQRIFDEIIEKLLDDDIKRSLGDLKRIADYRNYRTYDIKKCLSDRELSLKNYGTGSGGQMETPSYVIRSAGLSSALHFDEGYSHLRMVMIDESFSKMDEHRCRAVIDYLSKKLGLQILFVVPSKSAGVLHESVDRLFQITKMRAGKPRGELDTCVMVNTRKMNKEKVSELWRRERTSIRNKARQMDFLELLDKKNNEKCIETA